MPLLAALLALSVASVPLAGGRLGLLRELELRRGWALLVAVAVQITILRLVPEAPPFLLGAAHLGSYGLAGVWLYSNRHVPGIALLAFGGALNALAIAANGGVMPASPGALALAGMPATTGQFTNSAQVADARLGFLGDVFALPTPLPLASVFSVGDIIIALGALYGLHVICASRAARRLGVALG